MPDFTPGPWEVSRHFDCITIQDADGFPVAEINSSRCFHSHKEIAANARLLAATPDLLEIVASFLFALQAVHDYLPEHLKKDNQQEINNLTAVLARIYGVDGTEDNAND